MYTVEDYSMLFHYPVVVLWECLYINSVPMDQKKCKMWVSWFNYTYFKLQSTHSDLHGKSSLQFVSFRIEDKKKGYHVLIV